jgi:Predicted transcriptional regulators
MSYVNYRELIPERIKELRAMTGMTQQELAGKIGVSLGTVAMWETGKRYPKFDTCEEMGKLFNVRPDYISGLVDRMGCYEEYLTKIGAEADGTSVIGGDEIAAACEQLLKDFQKLDSFGKTAVRKLIEAEADRCETQGYASELPYDIRVHIFR